ncbi:MAG: TRAP transporter small permease subunit [Steroidobacteraceae bacterium]|jgi:TRAP-type mannitol/chloroaromatic compound transport system permease small subunit|nr:TRAP transporter small permease subunit [Steroidobacteraceae bacterium]
MKRGGLPAVDALVERIGRAAGWLTLAMVLATLVVVVARHGLDRGWLWLQESITWMHAVVFMLGASWALREGDHVRVDILYRKLPPRGQALVDLAGTLLLLLPLCLFVAWDSRSYVLQSWAVREASREAGGMPALFLLKTMIPLGMLLLVLQGLSEALRAWRRFRGAGPDGR